MALRVKYQGHDSFEIDLGESGIVYATTQHVIDARHAEGPVVACANKARKVQGIWVEYRNKGGEWGPVIVG